MPLHLLSGADAAPYIPPPDMYNELNPDGEIGNQLPSGELEAAQLPHEELEAGQLPSGPEGEINNELPQVETPYQQVELVLDHEISELRTNVLASVSHAIQTGIAPC